MIFVLASFKGYLDLVKLLLLKGFYINEKNIKGQTALICGKYLILSSTSFIFFL